MRIWGKVFGFLFGFMMGKYVGAILGLWLGHLFDKGRAGDFSELGGMGSADSLRHDSNFFYTTFAVMGHMAKSKGRVTEQDIQFASQYMNQLGLDQTNKSKAQECFREGKSNDFPLQEQLKDFKRSCYGRRDVLTIFLEIQIQLAFADGELHANERAVLYTIAKTLGFSQRDLDKLLEMIEASMQFHQPRGKAKPNHDQLSAAYKVLGVANNADERTIKRAYKKLMAQHHPDKLVAKGLPEEMMQAAKQKTQDIQAAYDVLSRRTK